MLSRGIKLVSALAAMLFVTGGFVVEPAPSSQAAEAFPTTFAEAVELTVDLVGGTWDNRDDPTARGCLIAPGLDGQTTAALRLGDAPADGTATLAAIERAWQGYGYTVEHLAVGPVEQLTGTRGAGEVIIVRVSELATTLQGESECRPVGE